MQEEGKLYQRLHIPLQIVGLDPSPGDLQFFLEAAGRQASLLQPKAPKQAAAQLRVGFPTALVAVAVVLVGLFAIDELLFAPLRWGRDVNGDEAPAPAAKTASRLARTRERSWSVLRRA